MEEEMFRSLFMAWGVPLIFFCFILLLGYLSTMLFLSQGSSVTFIVGVVLFVFGIYLFNRYLVSRYIVIYFIQIAFLAFFYAPAIIALVLRLRR